MLSFFCCSEFFLLLTSRHTSIFFQFTPYCTSSLLSQTNRIKLFLLNSYRTGFNHKTKLGNRPSRRQRQAAQIKETAPVSNLRNQDPEYDQQSLVDGLMSISNYLSKKKHKVMIVAVGGAVSTILLQSRQSTHDFDFFCRKPQPEDISRAKESG